MNFPVEKQPSGQPPQPDDLSPRQKIEHAMSLVVMELIQHRRTIWLLVQQAGKPVILDETQCHPLWRMKATRLPDGKMQLEASQLPDPTDEQLQALAETLNGSKAEIGDAMQTTALKDHPPAYLEKCLKTRVVRRPDGYWVDAAFAKIEDGATPGEN